MVEENAVNENSGNDAMEIDENEDNIHSDEEGGLRVDDIYIPPPLKANNQFDTNGPRLMIFKIINENFKSYGGRKEIGPFHKCFSAIVGPNGSGKSNCIDSMLFVFGYRASKIRSKKLSVLIHNSERYPNVNSCTVSVHFQQIIDKPGEDYDVVPNSQFVISRTAFKDSSSFYSLNGKKVQFKEIARLLRSYGVDLDYNRFLILQGEVEQIAMMKPKGETENDTGMLEFLEDIIGTVRFKEPLQKLSQKLELLSEQRFEKLNRLKIAEKEKIALEEPMQEAVHYLELENEITRLKHELYCYQRFATTKELSQQEAQTVELDKELSELINNMKEINDEKEEKSKGMKEKSKAWNNLQKQMDELVAKFDDLRKHDESLHAQLVEINKRRKANIASLKTEKSKLEELSNVPEKNTKDIKECENLIENTTNSKKKIEAELEKVMADLSVKTEPLLKKRSKLEQELISIRKNVDEAQAAFNIAQSELQLYTSIESTEKGKLDKLKESLESIMQNLAMRKDELKNLEEDIPRSEQELTQMQQEFQLVKKKETERSSKLRQMRGYFEEQKLAMNSNKSTNRVLESLTQEKREGRIPGIFGRLGDLGAIDEKYDVAVSTACRALDSIIVDTVSTAQTCIQFLRNNDIGRATFIPLEKQQHLLSRCQNKIQTPENVPRLFDLIRVEDKRVLPAFYYGLQDTLVANDLDQATRIAYGARRYRVVTLKGEIIELAGTMTGGGRIMFRGKMGQKVVKNELSSADIEKLQFDVDKVSEECNQYRARALALENQIHTLNARLKDNKIKKEKLRIEVKALEEQKPSLLAQLKVQKKKVEDSKSDPKQVQKLEKVMNDAKNNVEKVAENSKAIESQVNRINDEIDKLSGNIVKDKQKKIASLNASIEKAKVETRKLEVAIKTAERNIEKCKKRISDLENDIHNAEQRLRDIQKAKQEAEDQGKEYLKQIDELKERLSERDEALSSFKEALDALQAKENQMKTHKVDLDHKMKEFKNKIKELKHRISNLTNSIANLKLQSIPNKRDEELKELTDEELSELNDKDLAINLQKAQKRLPAEMPNMQVITEYREKDALYLQRSEEVEKVTDVRNKVRDIYETARYRRIQEFHAGFTSIAEKLKEMYRMITLGGDAELELLDSLDPFSEGITFSVRPPKKSWKNISSLSGGEKTLSSLALVFALHHYKPTPLYFMDEIDAALDFKNVSIVGNYIKERTKNAQFIIISLRSDMFELADYLVGIYKTFNCTKCITLDVKLCYEKNNIAPPIHLTKTQNTQWQRFNAQSQNVDAVQETNKDSSLELPPLGLSDDSQINDNSSEETSVAKKRKL